MAATFKTWTHPGTGQVRVYISALAMQGSAKVWVEQQPADSFGRELRVRIQSSTHTRGEAGNLQNDAEGAINAAAGARVRKWSDLLALASK